MDVISKIHTDTYTSGVTNICVLGALGHIGSGVIRSLATKYPNINLTIVDNLSTGKFSSLFGLTEKIKNFYQLDVRDSNLIKILKNQEIVFHFAAMSKAYDLKNEQFLYKHNMAATENVVKACAKYDVPLLFLSSTSIYERCKGFADENTLLKPPKNLYALSKFHEENLVSKYTNGFIFRLGSIHGISPGMNFHTAVNKFIFAALNKEMIQIWTNSINIKSAFLSLSDLINIIESQILNNTIFNFKQITNLVGHNSTPLEIFNAISKLIPKAQYELVKGESLRNENLIISSENKLFEKIFHTDSINKDLKETVNLFKNKFFNWNSYYRSPI
jgi:UDP-glucose 4-epimerase